MECTALFIMQLFLTGHESILKMDDGVTVANIGIQKGKEEDQYLALLATTDDLTSRIAADKGYSRSDGLQCTINGKQATVWIQLKTSPRA